MSQKIHLLSPDQAQKIAAGEVIERPANIVKELLENSIDAGATTITIHIEKAGKNLIKIADDGCGMSPEDAKLCFARHATSKLTKVDELMALDTFGFRGEALASVAAVSKVTLTTKQHDSAKPLGTQVIYEHGKHVTTEQVACRPGTTISISDLFATVPVRKTFLKQDETEWNQVMAAITGLALTYIDRSIKIFKDGNLALNAPKVATLRDRITQIWGHNIGQQLTEVEMLTDGPVKITGLASTPPFARYGKQQLIFFVNNRLVKNSDISKAIVKGYKQSLPPGKYPAACLFIQTDRTQVDVNIHPRKEEVRFTKPGVVTRTVQETITYTLEQAVNKTLSKTVSQPQQKLNFVAPQINLQSQQPTAANAPAPAPQPFLPDPFEAKKLVSVPLAPKTFSPQSTDTKTLQAPLEPAQIQEKAVITNAPTIIGQLFATYIIMEKDNELILVDQHAAHERILYHQFANNFIGKEGTQLLFPETITLTESAIAAIIPHQAFFADQGIGLHQAGPAQIAITSTPPKLQKESLADLLRDVADFIATHQELEHEVFMRRFNEHVHSHMACKAAVRAGDVLDTHMMQSLVEQLLKTPNRFMCVHGRPTMWPISRVELEKRFRRRT